MKGMSYNEYMHKYVDYNDMMKMTLDNAYLGFGKDFKYDEIFNNFDIRMPGEFENPHKHFARFIRDPDNFYFTLKHIFNVDLLPFQLAILKELWQRKYPMLIASRGGSKSFMLGLYALLRAFITQGSKVVIVGAAFRQSKVVFDYCEKIWQNAPVLRDIVNSDKNSPKGGGPKHEVDKLSFQVGASTIIGLPIGTGDKIRGQRATHILADEFASINEEIYENVIAGFAAVSANPVEEVKNRARREMMRDTNLIANDNDTLEFAAQRMGNQAVIAGTAYYDFNHFSKYWKRYKKIVNSKGDIKLLAEIFPNGVPQGFDWKHYSVIRIPVELLPKGFMDEQHVARSAATVHSGIFNMEFGSSFSTDSNDFFKRTLVQSCVSPVRTMDGLVEFSASLTGNPNLQYVYGIDPASEKDNFSIVVLEIHPNHRRIVYCWTTNRASHTKKIQAGVISEQDFYGYVARKIRELMKTFPTTRIALDSQGGGVAVEEALHDGDKIRPGEMPIWRIIDEKKPNPWDEYQGKHILEMINFADANWTKEANHGLRKDFEDKALIFPEFDPASLSFAAEEDMASSRIYDTLEDNVMEIEELKDELATIVHTQTGTAMRDRWDTPEIKTAGSKKGRLRKDRYSSLLMANMAARSISRAIPDVDITTDYGGFAHTLSTRGGPIIDYDGGTDGSEFGIMVCRGRV